MKTSPSIPVRVSTSFSSCITPLQLLRRLLVSSCFKFYEQVVSIPAELDARFFNNLAYLSLNPLGSFDIGRQGPGNFHGVMNQQVKLQSSLGHLPNIFSSEGERCQVLSKRCTWLIAGRFAWVLEVFEVLFDVCFFTPRFNPRKNSIRRGIERRHGVEKLVIGIAVLGWP
jgi:hypothetical protein